MVRINTCQKILFLSVVISALFFMSIISFAQQLPSEINPEVQLQDNGWIRIVNQYLEEIPPETFFDFGTKEENEKDIKRHKEAVKLGVERENVRRLNVKIQFLKPCIATYRQPDDTDPPGPFDLVIPRFKCTYRTKIFATFFSSKGVERDSSGQFPYAPRAYSANPDIIVWKKEMLPGETMWIQFFIPGNVESWHVWVPK